MEAPVSVPPPPEAQAAGGREGCARKAFIGCGIAALLILALVVGFFLYVRRNPGVMTDLAMRQIETHWGPDVTDQDKADLRAAYADFRKALNEHRINQQGLAKLQFMSGNRSNQINRDQVRQITEGFREAAGGAPSSGGSSSATPSVTPSS